MRLSLRCPGIGERELIDHSVAILLPNLEFEALAADCNAYTTGSTPVLSPHSSKFRESGIFSLGRKAVKSRGIESEWALRRGRQTGDESRERSRTSYTGQRRGGGKQAEKNRQAWPIRQKTPLRRNKFEDRTRQPTNTRLKKQDPCSYAVAGLSSASPRFESSYTSLGAHSNLRGVTDLLQAVHIPNTQSAPSTQHGSISVNRLQGPGYPSTAVGAKDRLL